MAILLRYPPPMTPVARLRARTSPAHDVVDAAFGAHDLAAPDGYRAFLLAHARALPAAEAALRGQHSLPAWRPRAALLAADLADLGAPQPVPLPFELPSIAGAAMGALYVTEGSRLGGIMLARGVSAAMPSRYLADKHLPGEWRALLNAIDATGAAEGEDWIAGAITGAEACFALYARAA